MKTFNLACATLMALASLFPINASAVIEGSNDPESVVEQWSTVTAAPKIIDINFSDTSWPDTWTGSTAVDCPSFEEGGYVNAILSVPTVADESVTYPVLFHNCTFANKKSSKGFSGVTAAFARQYFLGQNTTGNSATTYNNWTVKGHTHYLEDNIVYDSSTGRPTAGEAGFVQMCRDASTTSESMHGWMEIDHIPYIHTLQWSWSSTSWGRGIKLDIKIGDADWKPLVWMGSEKQKQGWTVFSDQGYFMENVIDASDVSLRWRVWDGEDSKNFVQSNVFTGDWCTLNPLVQRQSPRVHKIKIYGTAITSAQADYARQNPLGNVGTLSDLSNFGNIDPSAKPAPDADAPVVFLSVGQDGSYDHATIQAAVNAVPKGSRGVIFIAPGIYDEHVKTRSDHFISLIGSDPATTIITSSVNRGGSSSNTYQDCCALQVYCPCFYAENLTIRNTSGNVGQAEALFTNGDAHVFRNCRLLGFQDTYKANVGNRGYFINCFIEGGTDFIYDGGLEWFEDCEIHCLQGGQYVTAPAEAPLSMTKAMYPELKQDLRVGLIFNNCRVTAADGVKASSYYLGRPWKASSSSIFLNSTVGTHVRDIWWADMSGNLASATFADYNITLPDGTPVDLSGRNYAGMIALTQHEVESYINPDFLFKTASKTSFDYRQLSAPHAYPEGFSINASSISWTPLADDLAYIVWRDGQFDHITRRPVIDSPDPESRYAVSSISSHGNISRAVTVAESAMLPAFPSAEGFGKYATGGRGGKVVTVTSPKDDNSEGTLRWAFRQYPGEPITIVFNLAEREIVLDSMLRVNRADWTLAGQSSPFGITITRHKVNLGGSQNFIVRNVRFRIGRESTSGVIMAENALGAENCLNFIFDHCSFGWSVEENMNTADSHFLTVQWSMVHEGLYDAGHSKGARGYGCQWGGSPATYHHNLLAHNYSRSCRFNGARGEDYVVFLEYANNVNYNYGKRGGCYGGENTADISSYNGLNSAHECNFINNYYKPGPVSDKNSVEFFSASYAREGATSWAPSRWYVNGNIAEGFPSVNADNWLAVSSERYSKDQIKADSRIIPANPYYRYSVTGTVGNYVPETYMLTDIQSAADAYASVVGQCGAGCMARDNIELRIAEEVQKGTSNYNSGTLGNGIIDRENQAEGFWPDLTLSEYVKPDTDGDGMPDSWEVKVGLDPNVADNNRLHVSGYTALEIYLSSVMKEFTTTPNMFDQTGLDIISIASSITFDTATATLSVPAEALGSMLTVYTVDGRMVLAQTVDAESISLSSLPKGSVYILAVRGAGIAPAMFKAAL